MYSLSPINNPRGYSTINAVYLIPKKERKTKFKLILRRYILLT